MYVAYNSVTIIGGMSCGISSSIHWRKGVGISEKYASYDAVLDAVLQIFRLVRIRRKMVINCLIGNIMQGNIMQRIEVKITETFYFTTKKTVYT